MQTFNIFGLFTFGHLGALFPPLEERAKPKGTTLASVARSSVGCSTPTLQELHLSFSDSTGNFYLS